MYCTYVYSLGRSRGAGAAREMVMKAAAARVRRGKCIVSEFVKTDEKKTLKRYLKTRVERDWMDEWLYRKMLDTETCQFPQLLDHLLCLDAGWKRINHPALWRQYLREHGPGSWYTN